MNDLLHDQSTGANGPVECLGQAFASEQARREHFLKLLVEKLKDPTFRKLEGFPQGDLSGGQDCAIAGWLCSALF